MGATRAFSTQQTVFQQSLSVHEEQENQTREAFDLLTLVNQSYRALDIGQLNNIDELRRALEDVDSVKKSFMESNFPSDTESLGLATTINSSEELETFERMVSFFEKRKPVQGISWEMFSIENGNLCLKSREERNQLLQQARQRAAVARLIDAIKEVESLGLNPFDNFRSSVISRENGEYSSKV